MWKFIQNAFRLRFGQEIRKTHRLGQEQSVVKLSYLYGHMYTINCTAPSLCGLPHSVRDESLQMQCQHHVCFGAQEQLESVTFLWKFIQNAFRLRFGQESCKTHSLGQEQSVVKLSYLYGHMYTINCTAPMSLASADAMPAPDRPDLRWAPRSSLSQ